MKRPAEADFAEAVQQRKERAVLGELGAAALEYAKRGWAVFPLAPREKVPLAGSRGYLDATTNPERIREWWSRTPDANIGISTDHSPIDVIDVDAPLGEESLEELEDRHGKLPETVVSLTGGGGTQLLFRSNGHRLPSSAATFGLPGLDTRGAKGYVCAPPSIHPSGRPYAWNLEAHPADMPLAELPQWVLEAANGNGAGKPVAVSPSTSAIPEGRRNSTLTSMAGTMRRRGMDEAAIRAALVEENAKCAPPLPRQEIERIAKSVSRYDPEPAEYHLTDMGSAERFVDEHADRVRYCHTWRQWLVWTGTHWQRDDTGEVARLARETVAGMYAAAAGVEDPNQRKALAGHAIKSERADRLRAMLSLAESNAAVAVTDKAFDTDPWLLNVANGTLDLRTCELREHRPEDMATHCLAVAYDPDVNWRERAQKWALFLARVFDADDELAEFVQRAVGYSLTGLTREQCFFLLYGPGANGKTSFLEAVKAMLGDRLAQSARFETFLVRRGEHIPNDVARMRGSRFVTAIESEDGRRLDEATIKQLTGGDTVTARFMRAEYFEFRPEFKLWFGANHKPTVRGTDIAIWRRVKLVPFAVTIPEAERDPDLAGKLREELPGILAWAVEGCRKWVADGLGTCPKVEEHTRVYRCEQDVLGQFLGDECEVTPERGVLKSDLYDRYKKWCDENREKPVTKRTFGNRLREREPSVGEAKSGNTRTWTGIGLAVGTHGTLGD